MNSSSQESALINGGDGSLPVPSDEWDVGGPIEIIAWQEAERHLGKRLDRRRTYGFDGRDVFETITGTDSCSGCCETGEHGSNPNGHPTDTKRGCLIGSGCEECGYTGKRRFTYWIEYRTAEVCRDVESDGMGRAPCPTVVSTTDPGRTQKGEDQ